ncbi:MAG: hypothetical protein AAFX79_00545 [Planctomycetota bacterium]
MDRDAIDRWLRVLGAATSTHPLPEPAEADGWIGTFADEAGHRRDVDRPLLGWLLGVAAGDRGAEPIHEAPIDVVLWAAARDGSMRELGVQESGSLQPFAWAEAGRVAIEVWTERELSAIQALWAIGIERRDEHARTRAEDAARWCVAELQPDNATNHPWAIDVFAWLGARGDGHADLYAQTLLHNATIATGRPGRFSAMILHAAARSLRAAVDRE